MSEPVRPVNIDFKLKVRNIVDRSRRLVWYGSLSARNGSLISCTYAAVMPDISPRSLYWSYRAIGSLRESLRIALYVCLSVQMMRRNYWCAGDARLEWFRWRVMKFRSPKCNKEISSLKFNVIIVWRRLKSARVISYLWVIWRLSGRYNIRESTIGWLW